uniref:VPS37D subunit of ESCRT-I n=1 Tax=Catharus ustulatus TaxID=91951 RepID=A0A8C3UM62_CATUS
MQRAECRIRVAGAGCAQGYRMRTAGAGCAQRVQGALMGCRVTAQLRALLQDEPRLQRAARLSRKFQSLQLERETCLASNCTQARVNLSLRPRLEDGKASLAIKYQELQEIREACWDKQQRLGEWKWSPQSALGQLQAKLDASEAESEEQIKQFLTQELPLESFLESFCQSRTQSHICRTQLEKLQELLQKEQLQKDQVGRDPAVVPFPVPAAPPKHRLPALGQQPASPCSETPSPGSPLRLVGHIPLLSPQPGRGQEQPQHQNQEPPHR